MPLPALFDGRLRVQVGDRLRLCVPPEAAYVFDADGRALRRLGRIERSLAA